MKNSKKIIDQEAIPTIYNEFHRLVFNRKLLQTSLSILILTSVFGPIPSVHAANVTADITSAKASTNSVSLNFSVIMPDSEVLYKTNFESNQFSTYYGGSGNQGNQSYVSTDKGTSLQIADTITNRKGNAYGYPSTSSDTSLARTSIASLQQGARLQAQYDMRSLSGSTNQSAVQFSDIRGKKGLQLTDDSGKIVRFRNTTSIVPGKPANTPQIIPVYVDGGTPNWPDGKFLTILSSANTDWHWAVAYYKYQAATQSLVLDSSNSSFWYTTIGASGMTSNGEYTFQPGDSLVTFPYGDFGTGMADIGYHPDWTTYSRSLDIPADTTQFDLGKYGANLSFTSSTNGIMQLDEFKIGYAQKAIIYRNGQQIYAGYDSNYNDNAAVDMEKPNKVESLNYTFAPSHKNVVLTWAAPIDNGSDYTYTIQGQLRDGSLGSVQDPTQVKVTSGIAGYIVTPDNNPNTVITSGSITTSDTRMTINPNVTAPFIHVAAVDGNDNIGPTQTITLQDNSQPELNLSLASNQLNRYGNTIYVSANDPDTWITKTTLPNGHSVATGVTTYDVTENGDYTFTTYDWIGNSSSKTITVANIDKEGPTISFTPDGSDWQANQVDVDILTADRSLQSVRYIVNQQSTRPDINAQWIEGNENFSLTLPSEKQGIWYIHVLALDSAGNESYGRSKEIKIKALPEKLVHDDIQLSSSSSGSIQGILPSRTDESYEVINQQTGNILNIPAGSNSFIDTDLTPGTKYTYAITPINVSGRGESISYSYTTIPAVTRVEGVYALSETSMRVQLESVPSATHYLYELADQNGVIISNGSMNTSHIFEQLSPNHSYTLSIHAVNASGQSLESRYTFLTIPSLAGLHITGVGTNFAQLSWDSVTGDVYYDVKRNDEHIVTVTKETYTTVTDNTYNEYHVAYPSSNVLFADHNLMSGTHYNYAIAVTNASGQSNFKNISLSTLPVATELIKKNVTIDSASYVWRDVRGATGYDIYLDGIKTVTTEHPGYEFSGLNAGSVHVVSVVPFNDFGTGEAADTTFITLPESIHQDLRIQDIAYTSAQLKFSPVKGASSYIATINGKEYISSTSTIDLNGLTAGEIYSVHVYAVNESGKSAVQSLQFQTIPLAPKSGHVHSNTNVDLQLAFSPSEGALYYRIYDTHGKLIQTTSELHVNLSSPGAGILSSFGIAAVGKNGESPERLWIQYQGAPIPSQTNVLNILDLQSDSATIGWESFKGATSYLVYDGNQLIHTTEDNKVRIDHLSSSTTYNDFGIRAVNSSGIMGDLYKLSFETNPFSEFQLDTTDITTSSATVHALNGSDLDLFVFADDKNELQRSSSPTLELNNLSDAHRYTIKVWTENSSGIRSEVQIITFKTKDKPVGNVPSTILNPAVTIDQHNPDKIEEDHNTLSVRPIANDNDLANRFIDVKSRYSESAINDLADRGIVNGDQSGKFNPTAGITRAEFVSMLLRARNEQLEVTTASLPTSNTFNDHPFSDISEKWYTANIVKATEMNYISGYPDGTFKPDRIITRAEAATILQSVIKQQGNAVYQFTDNTKIPSWAKTAINTLGGELFIGYENGQFKPKQKITKEETAVVIYRLLNK
ncbi:S-layer homology domain-containing protein [Paenibacillus kyungheensis]|uniref:S-layer homology domain-containing protein n=1 Tax=Paenibacillus kyungheensis TaxID=1452732 RepID=A0AAX3LWQ1_9BACL|nr:S-layer homology domain-containing protein [Paenibacillus kyungheensis]WCT53796.1 S-layer homology domain-containing protein [Paenibacillus kyungheensis]